MSHGLIDAKSRDWRMVPERLRLSLNLWVSKGVTPGFFLSAVLKNDLKSAMLSADPESATGIYGLVRFLWQHCPAECWGSVERFNAWAKRAEAAAARQGAAS